MLFLCKIYTFGIERVVEFIEPLLTIADFRTVINFVNHLIMTESSVIIGDRSQCVFFNVILIY